MTGLNHFSSLTVLVTWEVSAAHFEGSEEGAIPAKFSMLSCEIVCQIQPTVWHAPSYWPCPTYSLESSENLVAPASKGRPRLFHRRQYVLHIEFIYSYFINKLN